MSETSLVVWHRNAGARTYHLEASHWLSTGKAACGADISNPYSSWISDGQVVVPLPNRVQLYDYPKRYGVVKACKRCIRKMGAAK